MVRHGRTEANVAGELLGRRDLSLDDLGRRQAEALAGAIGSPARVVASPLRRCRETAAALGPPVEIDERLVELDYGELEGTALRDVPAATWTRWRADTAWRPPGGETFDELAIRVAAACESLSEEASAADVVVVSHVSPVKVAVAWALGVGVEISWRCHVAPASITRIATDGGRASLRSFNEVVHLDGLD